MNPPLPIDGVLPPDLQGTLVRVGPGEPAGALHAVELRDGAAVSFVSASSSADANVLWHAGSLLALAETGLPQQFSGALAPEEFRGGLRRPIASHVHRDAATGGRVLFGVEAGSETMAPALHLGEWDAAGALIRAQDITLERATWQHDLGVTARHVVFMESPTEIGPDLVGGGAMAGPDGGAEGADAESAEAEALAAEAVAAVAVPFRWNPGAEGWIGVVDRDGAGAGAGAGDGVRWIRQDPCAVTHVLNAHDDGDAVVLHVIRYPVPESGQPFDLASSVVGPGGIGGSPIGGGLGVLERWRIEGDRCEQVQVDDRAVEYPQADPQCEGGPFRYGYAVELADVGDGRVEGIGLLQFDVARGEGREWRPGAYRVASEPLFVRAADGQGDDEGWLLTVVHDAVRGASDLYVLDASSFGPGRAPQAVVHLPVALPFRSHGTWVGAERYR